MPKNNNLNIIETDISHTSSSNVQRTFLISEVEGTHYSVWFWKRGAGLNYGEKKNQHTMYMYIYFFIFQIKRVGARFAFEYYVYFSVIFI